MELTRAGIAKKKSDPESHSGHHPTHASRTRYPPRNRSFSYLYLANVLGAVAGAIVPLALIERQGFRQTLYVGVGLNFLLALTAFALTLRGKQHQEEESTAITEPRLLQAIRGGSALWPLFGTGLTSMGVEVIWIRLYTPSLSTVVYAFAAILQIYLLSTYVGSRVYRRKSNWQLAQSWLLWIALGFSVLLAFFSADPRVPLPALVRVAVGVGPLSALVGIYNALDGGFLFWG